MVPAPDSAFGGVSYGGDGYGGFGGTGYGGTSFTVPCYATRGRDGR